MSGIDIPPLGVSSGEVGRPISAGTAGSSEDFTTMCRETWPDLPPGAKIAVLPMEDFEAVVAMTKGRTILSMRNVLVATLPASRKACRPSRLAPALEIATNILAGIGLFALLRGLG